MLSIFTFTFYIPNKYIYRSTHLKHEKYLTKQYLHSVSKFYPPYKENYKHQMKGLRQNRERSTNTDVYLEDHKSLVNKLGFYSQIIFFLDFPLQVFPKQELHKLLIPRAMTLLGEP